MTYKLFTDKKGYDGRLKKLLKLERKAGSSIISIDEGDTFTLITVENKGGEKYHAETNMPKVQIPVDTPDRQPESLPVVQAIPEKRSAEKSKPEKIKTLNVTVTPDLFKIILSGSRKIINTRHNPRKDRYFRDNSPGFIKIKNNGGMIKCKALQFEETPDAWRVHIGEIIETSGCPCKHPPDRLYSWSGKDRHGPFTCIVCCRCGDVLRGGASHVQP
jgi:hypothetical protein